MVLDLTELRERAASLTDELEQMEAAALGGEDDEEADEDDDGGDELWEQYLSLSEVVTFMDDLLEAADQLAEGQVYELAWAVRELEGSLPADIASRPHLTAKMEHAEEPERPPRLEDSAALHLVAAAIGLTPLAGRPHAAPASPSAPASKGSVLDIGCDVQSEWCAPGYTPHMVRAQPSRRSLVAAWAHHGCRAWHPPMSHVTTTFHGSLRASGEHRAASP